MHTYDAVYVALIQAAVLLTVMCAIAYALYHRYVRPMSITPKSTSAPDLVASHMSFVASGKELLDHYQPGLLPSLGSWLGASVDHAKQM